MCLTKITYYSCKCVESRREVWCPLPKPACPESLKYPETKTLERPCPQHGGRARNDAPTFQERWSAPRETKPSNITFRQQVIPKTPLSPVSPVSEFVWSSPGSYNSYPIYSEPISYPTISESVTYPTLPQHGASQFPNPQVTPPNNSSGRHQGSSRRGRPGSGGRRSTGNANRQSEMSATVNPRVDLPRINMPGRNRSSMYNLNSLREHQAREASSSPPPPVPALPQTTGIRRSNANASRRPAPIDTSVWRLNTRRTSLRQGAVAKPRSPRSHISPRTAAQGQHQASIRSYREALGVAQRWVATLHGPWTAEAFRCQPCIACLQYADQHTLWLEFERRQAQGGVRRERDAQRVLNFSWGRGGGGQHVYGAYQATDDQSRDRYHRAPKKTSNNASSGCEVM
jgi:hypothetical protein